MKQLQKKKLIMIVNVACEWGFTNDHYTEIVKIHNKWKDSGF